MGWAGVKGTLKVGGTKLQGLTPPALETLVGPYLLVLYSAIVQTLTRSMRGGYLRIGHAPMRCGCSRVWLLDYPVVRPGGPG